MELMIVFAIIVTISGVVLSSQSTFNKTLVLSNTAYDIALSLRSAETYGISSRVSGATANAGYGVHVEAATLSSFIFFADTSPGASCTRPDCRPGDYAFSSGLDTTVQTYALGNGIRVGDFCVYNGSWICSRNGDLPSLDIVFERPNPDAYIHAGSTLYSKACLTIRSPQGGFRFISISSSGQIIANAASNPSSCHEL
ncbi:MAG: hypothetical protein PHD04_00975 [Candidatus Pacebacteria bacterium]|nr:hypothetical protein [Candidatus Paceibacterota bacterium]